MNLSLSTLLYFKYITIHDNFLPNIYSTSPIGCNWRARGSDAVKKEDDNVFQNLLITFARD